MWGIRHFPFPDYGGRNMPAAAYACDTSRHNIASLRDIETASIIRQVQATSCSLPSLQHAQPEMPTNTGAGVLSAGTPHLLPQCSKPAVLGRWGAAQRRVMPLRQQRRRFRLGKVMRYSHQCLRKPT